MPLMNSIFPPIVHSLKQQEFMHISKGNRTVHEYELYFTNPSHFAPQIFTSNEKTKAKHFERGLCSHIRDGVVVFQLPTYKEVVNKALMVEKILNDKAKRLSSKKSGNNSDDRSKGATPPKRLRAQSPQRPRTPQSSRLTDV